jgi:tetratricopeptide (TPR) repeat protein
MGRQRKKKNVTGSRRTGNPAADKKTPEKRSLAAAVCVFLALAVFLVFGQSVRHEFINFDDPLYVSETPQVTGGPTLDGIAWAFHTDRAGNWHPLTWLSLMLDGTLSGTQPWAYHLTNVLLHATAAVVLFLALWRMTGALWPAAFCAALFAVHPLRAESVAWISERKDVLSGLFFMLALAAYVGYVRRPSLVRYLAVTACFVFGLMSKPAVVTLPFVLLLLDYWPLGRSRLGDWETGRMGDEETRRCEAKSVACLPASSPFSLLVLLRLILEKIPWFLLSAVSCVISPIAQGSCIFSLDRIPLDLRVANALVSYVMYAVHFFYPAGLSAFYPHPGPSLPLWSWKPMAAAALLVVVSAAAFRLRRRVPWLTVGWFWYCGMLVPMIGLVQVGSQAMADRYTYLPEIGLSIAVAWSAARAAAMPAYRRLTQAAAVAAVVSLMVLAWVQVSYWHDGVLLWTHAVDCNSECALAHNQLGDALLRQQPEQIERAIDQFQAALKINPNYPEPRRNLVVADKRLGGIFVKQGRLEDAVACFQQAINAQPDDADTRYDLGVVWNRLGKTADAIAQWRETIRLRPEDVDALDQLAWMLATHPVASNRNGAEATKLAERAVQLTDGRDADILATLAAAHAECGRFSEAIAAIRRAIDLAASGGDSAAADAFRAQLEIYRSGSAYRESPNQQH